MATPTSPIVVEPLREVWVLWGAHLETHVEKVLGIYSIRERATYLASSINRDAASPWQAAVERMEIDQIPLGQEPESTSPPLEWSGD